MALITWEEISSRSLVNPTGAQGPIVTNPVEAKKAFDFYIQQPKWKTLSKSKQLKRHGIILKKQAMRANIAL